MVIMLILITNSILTSFIYFITPWTLSMHCKGNLKKKLKEKRRGLWGP